MTTAPHQNIGANRHPLPASLATWFDKSILVQLVLEAVQETNCPPGLSARPPGGAATGNGFQQMLTLATYCYATGIYGSRQIEFEVTRDEIVRYLCDRREPEGNAIRQFRRLHRERIREVLTRLLRLAWKRRATGGWKLVSDADTYLVASLNLSLPAEPLERFAEDAERRIQAAIQADSMALDD